MDVWVREYSQVTERQRRDCETTAASVRERERKKKKTRSHRFNCHYKPSSGECCHRPLAERWKETDRRRWGERVGTVPSRLLPHYIHHTPPLDYLNPDNAYSADTPTPPNFHQAHFIPRPCLFFTSSIFFFFASPSPTTLKVRVGSAR